MKIGLIYLDNTLDPGCANWARGLNVSFEMKFCDPRKVMICNPCSDSSLKMYTNCSTRALLF